MAKLSDAARIRAYFIKHPKAKPAEAVKALGVKPANVYVVRSKMKMEATAPNWEEPRLCPLENEGGTITLGAVQEPIDMVNNPPHYKIGGIDTIDFIEAKKLNYRLGNVVAYIVRADHKGNRMEDLKKALWYLQREIEKG
jgi:hypothetical protein